MYTHTQRGAVGIWILLVGIIIAGAAWWFLGRGAAEQDITENEAETAHTAQEFTISYTTAGFSPQTLTIKKGDTVVFENKTGKNASIASDEHPTHLLYPEFDQWKTDQRGKTEFRFTFEKVGTWNYHDHLSANMTGTIVVVE